jgi:hypothetical protein
MHPWEDWAETFAHYLHIRDAVQTATEAGVTVRAGWRGGAPVPAPDADEGPFRALVRDWIDLAGALNLVNRSLGAPDLYPFVLAPKVIDKLAFVDTLVRAAASTRSAAFPGGSDAASVGPARRTTGHAGGVGVGR